MTNVENFKFADGTIPVSEVLNDAPTDITTQSTSFDEGDYIQQDISFGSLSAIDPDANDNHSFSIVNDPSGLFFIEDGELKLADGSYDHETQDSYDVTIRATDAGGATYDKVITINVNDVNEAPTGSGYAYNEVSELTAPGTVLTSVSVTDPDAGDSLTYEIVGGSALFEMSGSDVVLKSGASLDFETAETHDFVVRATDSGGNTFDTNVTIDVWDDNEAPTDIDFTSAGTVGAGLTAGTVAATDPDAGDTITYALTDDAGGMFSIDADSGDLTLTDKFDTSTVQSYDITVSAKDSSGLTYDETMTISSGDLW